MKPHHGLLLLPMIAYVALTLIWAQQGIHSITGDEPHYLLTSDSLLRDRDLQVVNNYQLDTPVLRSMPPGATFGNDTHSINGSTIHSLGLPILLLPAYALGGVLAAKVWMALIIGLIPISVYQRTAAIVPTHPWPLLIALLVGFSPPLLIGSNQLYPDLLASLIIFTLLGQWAERRTPPSVAAWWAIVLLLSLLAWLHLKFLLPAILLGSLYARWPAGAHQAPTTTLGWRWLSLVALSTPLLYNLIAFGSPVGPYQTDAATSDLRGLVMVAIGLHLDRMQGIFVQVPLFLLGLFGLAHLVKEERRLALAGGVIYLAILIPSAAHTNWYGGTSFAGRFFWAVTLLWVFPLASAIRHLRQRGWIYLASALLVCIALSHIFIAKVLISNTYTYTIPTHASANWLDSNPYADYFDLTALQRAQWLPSFRNVESFAATPINWLALSMLVGLVATGFYTQRRYGRAIAVGWALWLLAALALIQIPPPISPARYPNDLTLRYGVEHSTIATRDSIQPGTYQINLGASATPGLRWECALSTAAQQRSILASGVIALNQTTLTCSIPKASNRMTRFEVRLYTPQRSRELSAITIEPRR